MLNLFLRAGTPTILPDDMDEEREKGESGSSSMDESDNEAVEKELTAEQEAKAREERRERREKLKQLLAESSHSFDFVERQLRRSIATSRSEPTGGEPTEDDRADHPGSSAGPDKVADGSAAADAAADPPAGQPTIKAPLQYMLANKIEIKLYNAESAPNPSGGAGGSSDRGSNSRSDPLSRPSNPSGEGRLFGQNDEINGAYKSVVALRKGARMEQILKTGGGGKSSLVQVGEFSNKDDNRSSLCHFRTVLERKQNFSFSFDPKSMKCTNCLDRGEHEVSGGGGGGQNDVHSE